MTSARCCLRLLVGHRLALFLGTRPGGLTVGLAADEVALEVAPPVEPHVGALGLDLAEHVVVTAPVEWCVEDLLVVHRRDLVEHPGTQLRRDRLLDPVPVGLHVVVRDAPVVAPQPAGRVVLVGVAEGVDADAVALIQTPAAPREHQWRDGPGPHLLGEDPGPDVVVRHRLQVVVALHRVSDVGVPRERDAGDRTRLQQHELALRIRPLDVLREALVEILDAGTDSREIGGLRVGQRELRTPFVVDRAGDGAEAGVRVADHLDLLAADRLLENLEPLVAQDVFIGGGDPLDYRLAETPARVDHDLVGGLVQRVTGEHHPGDLRRNHRLDDHRDGREGGEAAALTVGDRASGP